MTRKRIATLVATGLVTLGLAGPASALAAPVLGLSSTHLPPTAPVPAGTYAKYTLKVSNTGSTATSGDVTVSFAVPAGLKVTATDDQLNQAFGVPAWACTIAPGAQSVSCAGTESTAGVPLEPGQEACSDYGLTCRLFVTVKADANATPGVASPTIQASGGGAASPATASDPIDVGPPPHFDVASFDGGVFKQNGDPATQAGSHPATASTTFTFTTALASNGEEISTDDLKDTIVNLPPGLLGNPQALPTCTEAHLTAGNFGSCPPEAQVGTITLLLNHSYGTPGHPNEVNKLPVFNMVAPNGTPALLGFNLGGAAVQIYAKLRSGEDYGATVITKNAPESLPLAGITFAVWGVPAAPINDANRTCPNDGSHNLTFGCPSADAANPKPFFTLPTSCVGPGPNNSVQTLLDVTGWLGGEASSSFFSHDNTLPTPNPIGADGCNALDFSPTLQARPTTNVADSPSGLDVDLHIPQNDNPNGNAEAHLKDTTVTLPEGLVVNPSGANGLDGCSTAEFGLTTPIGTTPIHTTADPATCPDASKLGTVEVDSPLVDHPVPGAVYIADPYDNPFGSLLALYITVDDPQTGVVVKLAGEVTPDPDTGQLSATFENNPQLPFEDFVLHFKSGPHGALRTPATCGDYSTASSLTPWSGTAAATPSDPWSISQSPSGGDCPTADDSRPNSPSFDAGTVSPIAGAFSPMVVNLRRDDGSQTFSTVTVTPPPGLLGKLAGTPNCPEDTLVAAANNTGAQETTNPSCPTASQVGTVDVAAGAGPAPYNAKGKAYLAGPYKGAPLSLAIVTPATAGPFDLGVVVIRTALHIDPATAQITAVSDPIPAILQGIPLDVRSAKVLLDKPNFTLNGTSCNPMAFTGQLLSTLNHAASLSSPFQLGECSSLGFKPSMKLSLKGGTKRNGHPAFTSVLNYPTGAYANLAKAQVTLPPTMQLDQSHIKAPCTRPQFAAGACPDASVIGSVTATSPLVDYQLSGPVYLRTGNNPLPDLVLALHGPASQPIEVDVVGKVDTVHARLRTTFETVPDAPVSQAVIQLQGAGKGLLVNNTNLCTHKNNATVLLDGQNGKTADSTPKLAVTGCKAHKKHHNRHHRRHHARAVR